MDFEHNQNTYLRKCQKLVFEKIYYDKLNKNVLTKKNILC